MRAMWRGGELDRRILTLVVLATGAAACSGTGVGALADAGGPGDGPAIGADLNPDLLTNLDGGLGSGACGPTTYACSSASLLFTDGTPELFAITDTHLYFSTGGPSGGGAVSRVPGPGGAIEKLFAPSVGQAVRAAVVDPAQANLYFVLEDVGAKTGTLMRLSLAPPMAAPVAVDTTAAVPSLDNIGDIALVDDDIFYVVAFRFQGGKTSAGGLFHVPAAGGASVRVLTAENGKAMRARDGFVYFTGQGIAGAPAGDALVRVPITGGSAEVLLPADAAGNQVAAPAQFEVSARGIFWTGAGASVLTLPLPLALLGGAARVLYPGPSGMDSFAAANPYLGVDATATNGPEAVYLGLQFIPFGSSAAVGAEVVRIPLDGTTSKVIFEIQQSVALGRIISVGRSVFFSLPAEVAGLNNGGIAAIDRCGCTAH
jgi:hypothetical protein